MRDDRRRDQSSLDAWDAEARYNHWRNQNIQIEVQVGGDWYPMPTFCRRSRSYLIRENPPTRVSPEEIEEIRRD